MEGAAYEYVAEAAHFCVEMYFKACLLHWNRDPPKTHDLRQLLAMSLRYEPLWIELEPAMIRLMGFFKESRYADEPMSQDEALEAVEIATRARTLFRAALESPDLFSRHDPPV